MDSEQRDSDGGLIDRKRAAVAAEAMTWIGTPYHHAARVKGVGVDCAQILIGVYSACGLIDAFDTGPYPPDWHMHRSEERYLGWVTKYARRVARPKLGDMTMWKFGRCYAHGSIIVGDGLLVHSYVGRGVVLSRANEEPLAGRMFQHWSIF